MGMLFVQLATLVLVLGFLSIMFLQAGVWIFEIDIIRAASDVTVQRSLITPRIERA